jgi:asparagine synthase (glutamine-hydrolysing)
MSGFAGLIRLDGRPVDVDTISRLSAAVAHRGPDANDAWSADGAALVHAMLRTTPESANETQPLVDRELVIVADVRLDNRDELQRILSIDRDTTDAAFIAAAFRKWGRECVRHLEGDFSFAIWNRDERTLFCARDAFGVKPFVYAFIPGKLFAFGSEVRAVLVHPDVPRDLDESRIAAFLVMYFEEKTRTFHQSVKRLPGGSTLTLERWQVTTATYWFPRVVRPLRLRGGDAEYAEGFLEHFARAVRDCSRVTSPSAIGAMLSGGLDSSSIVCLARDQRAVTGAPPLAVFSWIFSDVMDADEREYQQAVIDAGGLLPVTLDSAKVDTLPWPDLDGLLPDGPVYAPNFYLNSVAAKEARAMGIRVLLDGLGGDSTISRGTGRFMELLLRGRIPTLIHELRSLRARRGSREPLVLLAAQHIIAPVAPIALVRFARLLRGRAVDPAMEMLSPRMVRLLGRVDWRLRGFTSTRQEHLQQFESPMIAEGLELFDRVMAHFGVEGRYPFFDRRLAEYCLSLPADQKFADGYTRIVARRAMEGSLPPKVQWRAGKGAPGLHILTMMRDSRTALDDAFERRASVLEPYVSMTKLRAAYARLLGGGRFDLVSGVRLWNAAVLARWFSQSRNLLPAPEFEATIHELSTD